MLDKKTLDPFVKDMLAWADTTIKAVEDELESAPFGMNKLDDGQFVILIDKRRANPNWIRWLLLPTTRGGKAMAQRYERITGRPFLSLDEWQMFAQQVGVEEALWLSKYTTGPKEHSDALAQ